MKTSSTNTFTEGMVCDLDPINVPNNVLTDCLNGTIITYDGNEYSLQNDKGNYPLSGCKLNPNFIPIGIKEHNGILYIVSINPITGEEEIGSYPSPKLVPGKEYKGSLNMNYIIKSAFEDNDKYQEIDYSSLSDKCQELSYIDPNLRVNVNDEFWFEGIDDSPFEKIEKYIIDNNGQKHLLPEQSTYFAPVSGKILLKNKIFKLKNSELKLNKCAAWKSDDLYNIVCSFTYNIYIDDFDTVSWMNDFKNLNYVIDIGNRFDISNFDDGQIIDWFGNAKIISKTFEYTFNSDSLEIPISIVPRLCYKKNKYIKISDLEAQIKYTLNEEESDYSIANSIYRHRLLNDNQHIEFEVKYPLAFGDQIKGFYEVIDRDKRPVVNGYFNPGVGLNYVQIPFNESFIKENYYIINFNLKLNDDTLVSSSKRLITSQVFNYDWGYDDYSQITGQQMIEKFQKNLRIDMQLKYRDSSKTPLPKSKWAYVNNEFDPYLQTLYFIKDTDSYFNVNEDAILSGNLYEFDIVQDNNLLEGPIWIVTTKHVYTDSLGKTHNNPDTLSLPVGWQIPVDKSQNNRVLGALIKRFDEIDYNDCENVNAQFNLWYDTRGSLHLKITTNGIESDYPVSNNSINISSEWNLDPKKLYKLTYTFDDSPAEYHGKSASLGIDGVLGTDSIISYHYQGVGQWSKDKTLYKVVSDANERWANGRWIELTHAPKSLQISNYVDCQYKYNIKLCLSDDTEDQYEFAANGDLQLEIIHDINESNNCIQQVTNINKKAADDKHKFNDTFKQFRWNNNIGQADRGVEAGDYVKGIVEKVKEPYYQGEVYTLQDTYQYWNFSDEFRTADKFIIESDPLPVKVIETIQMDSETGENKEITCNIFNVYNGNTINS